MHELGICDAMLRMVREIARENQINKIQQITVEVGTLSGVVPAYLEDCWVAVTDGTDMDGTKLQVEVLEGSARCLDCGLEFKADLEDLSCPKCRGKKLLPVSGRDLSLKEILASD